MNRLSQIYHEFPRKFWVVVGVHFVDKIGGTLVFPFFALYITKKFGVGMTQAGILLGILASAGMLGSVVGGALTDRIGRRKLILFGLIFSAVSALALGSVNDFTWLFPLAALVGVLSDVGAPAHAAMIADVLPKEQRQEGFGILRVVGNMAWLVGPTVGGFVARTSFFALFVIDALISCVVAVLFYTLMPETRPVPHESQPHEGLVETFRNYAIVLRDRAFVAFLAAAILMGMVYIQMYNSLSVFLRDVHGVQPQGYGFLLTASAITVIAFQFWTMRVIKTQPQFLMMALGTLFYMVGFGMFGVVSAYALMVLAVVIITVGEMIVVPTSQTIAAGFARVDMRGRYMAAYGLSSSLPAAIGPLAAGIVLDRFDPNLLWYLAAVLCAVSASAFYGLHLRLGTQVRFASTVRTAAAVAWILAIAPIVATAQAGGPLRLPGVAGVSFGTAQRYKDTSGKEMCAIVQPLPDPPRFPAGTTEISYGVHLQPRSVKMASAQIVAPAGQELKREPCNAFTLVERGFSQTLLGSTLTRIDKKPLAPGKYTLRVTVDGQTSEIPFEIAR